jgi:hypothetical protein
MFPNISIKFLGCSGPDKTVNVVLLEECSDSKPHCRVGIFKIFTLEGKQVIFKEPFVALAITVPCISTSISGLLAITNLQKITHWFSICTVDILRCPLVDCNVYLFVENSCLPRGLIPLLFLPGSIEPDCFCFSRQNR